MADEKDQGPRMTDTQAWRAVADQVRGAGFVGANQPRSPRDTLDVSDSQVLGAEEVGLDVDGRGAVDQTASSQPGQAARSIPRPRRIIVKGVRLARRSIEARRVELLAEMQRRAADSVPRFVQPQLPVQQRLRFEDRLPSWLLGIILGVAMIAAVLSFMAFLGNDRLNEYYHQSIAPKIRGTEKAVEQLMGRLPKLDTINRRFENQGTEIDDLRGRLADFSERLDSTGRAQQKLSRQIEAVVASQAEAVPTDGGTEERTDRGAESPIELTPR